MISSGFNPPASRGDIVVGDARPLPAGSVARWVGLVGWLCFTLSAPARSTTPPKLEYNRDIRPILSENCFPCHGPDSAARKGKLRLDGFADATAPRPDSRPAIVPGKPDQSELAGRIFERDEDNVMPPPKSHKVLTPEQKDVLKRWIEGGANYQPHWSLIPPTRPAVPPVKNPKWVRNPIDQFVLARLEQEKLKPAPEADRRTLARRVSLDLTGLPPSPGEVAAFVNDTSPDAYERFVDQQLASPRWGEHRGRYWLDAARYADTHGIHIDNYREIWAYRDWVIRAFNANLPFDQFTIEQLAGDLLPNATLDQKIASGYNRCNITTSEGGAIDEEYLVLYARDRTDTTSQVWLGTTAGCAVCHDHKYDPLSQKEFYAMSAFFNNTTQKAMDGNIKDTPPVLVVPKPEDLARWDNLGVEKQAAQQKVEDRRQSGHTDFDVWLPTVSAEVFTKRLPTNAPVFHAPLLEENPTNILVTVGGEPRTITFPTNAPWQDGFVGARAFVTSTKAVPVVSDVGDFEKDQPMTCAAWVRMSSDDQGALFARMDDPDGFRGWDFWIEGRRPGTHIVSHWPDDAIKVVSRKAIEKDKWTHVCVTYDGSAKAAGVKVYLDGEPQETGADKDTLTNSIRTTVPFKIGQRNKESALEKVGVQDVRLYNQVLKPEEVKELSRSTRMAWLLTKSADSRSEKEKKDLYSGWLNEFDATYLAAATGLAALDKEDREIRMRGTVAHVMTERTNAPEAHLLFRGQYDQRRDRVTPETPASLPPMAAGLTRDRLGFAQWLLAPGHPLTARVTVNRAWQELFGTGIVRTSGDFGVAGEMPSNPDLLDWLAVEFRDSGWNVKSFYKLLVTSATYRQSAVTTPAKLAKDPQNRLLSRGPRFRMDAEMIRDHALASSGLLVNQIGGPSVKPYQPDRVWEAVSMPNSDTSKYQRDDGEKLYRRSLYTFWKRSAPPASMEIFNAPSRETCTVRRERTDTPLQALVTLNDEQFVEAARHLAQSALANGGARDRERIDFMAQRLIARPLKPAEQKVVEAGLHELLSHYQAAPMEAEALLAVGASKADATLDKPTLAAYTMVANQLMNLDEVLNK